MSELVSDRFVACGGAWIDIASGRTSRILFTQAGDGAAERAWADGCAALSMLRHPLLNPLLDYGVAGGSRLYQAFESLGPVRASGESAARLLAHLVRFLRAHGVALAEPVADVAVRPLVAGPATRGRPLGIALQRIAVLDALVDTLDATDPAGPCVVTVSGVQHSGLSTLRVLIARAARLRGFVPIAAALLRTSVCDVVGARHVCIIADDAPDEAGIVGRFLAERAVGARRHVVFTFTRRELHQGPAVVLRPMAYTALAASVYRDRHEGPEAAEVLDAARRSGGRPGWFLHYLGASPYPRASPAALAVRESAPVYGGLHRVDTREASTRRTLGASLRATSRAQRLVAQGRHAAAARALDRAARVLAGRNRPADAAASLLALGRLARERGRTGAATGAFERARALDRNGQAGLEAAIELAAAWIDDGRLAEAEAGLKAARLAAQASGGERHDAIAAALLADCLRLQRRLDDALMLPLVRDPLAAPAETRVWTCASAARVHLEVGNLPAALRASRAALAAATEAGGAGAAIANGVMAVADIAAGDLDAARVHVREGLRQARGAKQPLEALRLRALAITVADRPAESRARLAARLINRARGRVPRGVLEEIERTCRATRVDTSLASGSASRRVLVDLESFVELCHAAPDDGDAVRRVCEAVLRRLRAATVTVVATDARVLASAGREWPGDPVIVQRVIVSGTGVRAEREAEPVQAAEPVRYNAELVAALACRWAPGSAVDSESASALLRMAALAVAGNVRGLLDRAAASDIIPLTRDIVGESDAARQLVTAIAGAARAPFPVLVEGESGTGKELVARAVHRLSARRDRRFCPLNCAALSDELIEAELFGHARGAFTGAVGERMGLFEEADGGTLFLDEIGELSARAQAKLLRVLQDGEVRRVGENVPRRVDVRVVAATNRRLAEEVAAGRFRADLRFRLDVVRIDVPPLRDRPGDVAVLARHFWADAAARVDSRATLAPEVLAALSRYDWPGNVRELQNVLAWMAVHSPRRGRVGTATLPAHIARAATTSRACTFEAARQEFERRFVRAALATANGRRASAAAALGVSRQGLAKMMRRLGLEGDGAT